MKRFSAFSFVIGVMAGVMLTGAWLFESAWPGSVFPFSSLPSPKASRQASALPESGAVAVADQHAGETAMIQSVTVPPPGVWVAVRETLGADLGNVLGAVRVSGPRSSIPVPLLRAMMPGKAYAVELYRDDNNGEFDPAENSVYVDFATGAPVIKRFVTN